jgi:hypothetical protein
MVSKSMGNGFQVQTPSSSKLSEKDTSQIEAIADRIGVPGPSGLFDPNGHPISISPTDHVTPEGSYSNQELANAANQRLVDIRVSDVLNRDLCVVVNSDVQS